MITEILKRMTGSELLLLNIVTGGAHQGQIDTELDRRALTGVVRPAAVRRYRHPAAARQTAGLTAVA